MYTNSMENVIMNFVHNIIEIKVPQWEQNAHYGLWAPNLLQHNNHKTKQEAYLPFNGVGLVLYYNMTVWILAGNYISFTIAAGLIRLHMPVVKKSRV